MLNKDINLLYIMLIFLLLIRPSLGNASFSYESLYNQNDIVSKYEHGGKEYQAVGKDSYGGYSYGKWQISTKRNNGKLSTFDFFLKYTEKRNPHFTKILNKNGGYKAAYSGNKQFIKTWKNITKNSHFQKIYDDFIIDTQIIPVYKRMNNSNNKNLIKLCKWGLNNKVIQAAINSTIIQHGPNGGYNILKNIVNIYNPKNKQIFLKHLYEYRKKKFPKYKSRYAHEYNDLQKYLNNGNSKKHS